jgi:glucosylceramidase
MPISASVIRSARGSGERLAQQPDLQFSEATADQAADTHIYIDPAITFQEILGFGGAFTESSAFALSKASAKVQDQVLRAYFDPTKGHGYSFCRLHMGSCDFSLGNWSQVEKPGDVALKSFSLKHDRKWLLPLIKRAQKIAGDRLRLFASPWSPPAWMKTNGEMNNGGKLKPEYRSAWARLFCAFIKAYAAEGVPIWGVTLQNEPAAKQVWDSCEYSAEEERDFIRDHLAPALDQAGLSHIQIILWDHNRDVLLHRAGAYYADRKVFDRVWGLGFHWYGPDAFDNVRLAHDAWPDKHLMFTEGCQEGGPHPGSWDVAERYITSMISDLNRWTEAWVDWNLILDEKGGPNHVGNLCSAPVQVHSASGAADYQPSFAAIGHVSRYIKPGAKRVLCSAQRDWIHVGAFANPDGSLACVIANRGDGPHALRLQVAARASAVVKLPPHAIVTIVAPRLGRA